MSNLVKPSCWYITTIMLALAVGCSYTEPSKNFSVSKTSALTSAQAPDSELIKKAKSFFNNLVALDWNYDSAMFDLYADDALIQNTRRYPDGRTKVLNFSSQEWKALGVKVMPRAKLRGDRDKHSQVTYTVEGDKVRISTQRYSLLKQYSSPRSLLVGPAQTGEWRIFEDISESRP